MVSSGNKGDSQNEKDWEMTRRISWKMSLPLDVSRSGFFMFLAHRSVWSLTGKLLTSHLCGFLPMCEADGGQFLARKPTAVKGKGRE